MTRLTTLLTLTLLCQTLQATEQIPRRLRTELVQLKTTLSGAKYCKTAIRSGRALNQMVNVMYSRGLSVQDCQLRPDQVVLIRVRIGSNGKPFRANIKTSSVRGVVDHLHQHYLEFAPVTCEAGYDVYLLVYEVLLRALRPHRDVLLEPLDAYIETKQRTIADAKQQRKLAVVEKARRRTKAREKRIAQRHFANARAHAYRLAWIRSYQARLHALTVPQYDVYGRSYRRPRFSTTTFGRSYGRPQSSTTTRSRTRRYWIYY